MSLVNLGVQLNFTGAAKMFAKGYSRTIDLRPWFKSSLAPSLSHWMTYQFLTKGRAFGTPWAPIDPRKDGAGIWGPSFPLVRTGALMDSLTELRGAKGAIRKYERLNFVWGTNLPYAAFQDKYRKIIPDELPAKITGPWEASLRDYIERQLWRV